MGSDTPPLNFEENPVQETSAPASTSPEVFNVRMPESVMAGQILKFPQIPIAVRGKRRFQEELNLDRSSAVQCRHDQIVQSRRKS